METVPRRHSYKLFFVIVLLLPSCLMVNAQLNYTFSLPTAVSVPAANAYAYNAGTVIIAPNQDDVASAAQSIGFTFTYNCVDYTQFMASSNGWMVLGTGMSGPIFTNALATTGQGPILAPLWDDMKTSGTGNVNYKLTGVAPNRILTIEWLKILWNYNAAGPVMSYQVKLYETSNIVDFVYFREATTINAGSASIGINSGTSSTDFYSVDATPAATQGVDPGTLATRPTNRTYRWTPANMTFVSATTTQANTSSISKCNPKDQVIVGVEVVANGNCNPFSVTQFTLNMAGSTLPGVSTDATKIHIYYTGNASGFSPVNEFLPGGTTPSPGNFTVSGSQQVSTGTNYFWVAYDLNTVTSINGDVLDAKCGSVTMSGGIGAQTPTVQNPAGNRPIAACTVAPGGISGMSFWIKGNAGTSSTVDGTAINAWNDQSGNARHASQGTGGNQPVYKDNSTDNVNFNPAVGFINASSSFMDITSNGILSTAANPYTVYAVIKPVSGTPATPGKFLFAGTNTPNDYNSFDVRNGSAFNDSWDVNDLKVSNTYTAGYPGLATFDFNTTQREMFVSGSSVGTKVGNNRFSADANNALGCQRTSMIEFYDGSIAEIITYANYSHNASQHYQVESYLGIKYGVTLQHNYLSSTGATVWDLTKDPAYNTNIMGIARDDNSTLSQKESKSTSTVQDMLTAYIGPAKTTNQVNNTGSFTAGDKSFFITGNNNAPIIYPWGTPITEIPAGICCRLDREWLSQKTNFTNVDLKLEFDFNVVTPGYSPLNTADLRLLVDADGDFTNATVLNTPTIGINVAGSVVTITVPASQLALTPYFTLASVSMATALPVSITGFAGACRNNTVPLVWTKQSGPGNSFTIERSNDGTSFMAIGTLQSNVAGPVDYTWTDFSPQPGNSYYRLKISGTGMTDSWSNTLPVSSCSHDNLQLATDAITGQATLLLQLSQNAKADISLCDMLGQQLDMSGLTGHHSFQAGYYHLPVTGRQLAKGVYVLSVAVNGVRNVFRVIQR